jgi:hypothetical protein
MMESRMMKSDGAALVAIKQILTKQIGRLTLGGALALVALSGMAPSAARAQDSDKGLFGTMLKSLGIGGDNEIEYRERPPLVVPPTRDLPPPQASGAARDPNWPVDRQAAEKQKKGNQVRDLDKIPAGPRPVEPGVAAAPNPYTGSPETTATIPPSQPAASSGFFGNLFSSGGSERPAGSPPPSAPMRKSLTEPPADYESPSPSQPYGAPTPPVPKADAAKAATTQTGSAPGL